MALAACAAVTGTPIPAPEMPAPFARARRLEGAVWSLAMAHQCPDRYHVAARDLLAGVLQAPPCARCNAGAVKTASSACATPWGGGRMTAYTANVGRAEARWLADEARGPLSPEGFYGRGINGVITDLGDGRVVLDENAVTALRGLPPDRDGYVLDMDGPILCVGGVRHRLVPEPSRADP
jgi:hypothetical protein